MMCGAPGSGKSTWAKENLIDKAYYVSRDEIRFSLLKDGEKYFSHEDEVIEKFYKIAAEILKNGKDVIVDASHLNRKSRFKTINGIKKYIPYINYEVYCILMNTPYKICCERNDKRTGRANVPHDVIKSMFNSIEIPVVSEHNYIKEVWIINNSA